MFIIDNLSVLEVIFLYVFGVTPCAGVWIEILKAMAYFKGIESLPVRECGLKLSNLWDSPHIVESLPVRECGLKFGNILIDGCNLRSLPVRECGLKFG